jgi:mannose-6-phosphate isomerase-like protein (cupin superfamily)
VSDRVRVYSLDADDMVERVGAPDWFAPRLSRGGGWAKLFVTDPNLDYATGHIKLSRGNGFETFFWYDEFFVVRQGRGRVVATDRISGEETTVEVGSADTVFVAKGVHIRVEGVSDEPWVVFWVAFPAPKKDEHWLARMMQQDIGDVRKRDEYDP